MNILIVDDDQLVSLSLKTILEAQPDITVMGIGKNGYEAITLYEQHMPDVLLMDIRMDELSGLEAASEILKNHPDAKILLLTCIREHMVIVTQIIHCSCIKVNFEESCATIERTITNRSNAGSNCYTCKACAIPERRITNRSNAIGNCYAN